MVPDHGLTFGLNGPGIYGASGAIAGIVVLFAFNFPNVTILFFFVLPMPAWVFGVLVVLLDIYGAVKGGSEVAYVAHLAGAALRRALLSARMESDSLDRRPDAAGSSLRSAAGRVCGSALPDDEPPHPDFSAEVDRILEKIYREGEGGLTPKERQTLEKASREYQRKGAGNGDGRQGSQAARMS